MDIILDCIGGSYAQDNLASLAVDGTWVLYGLMGGAELSGPVLGGKNKTDKFHVHQCQAQIVI